VQHAYVHVPHYRDAMREGGLDPAAINSLEDVRKLPLLTKTDVRTGLYFDLFADNHHKKEMLRISTSGSTGEPFVTYADKYQLEFRFATTLRALEWTGWRFGDRQARLWHQTIGMSKLEVMRERIDAWFMRRLFIPAWEMSPDALEEFVVKIRDHRPVLVDGYAESFNFLANYALLGKSPGFSPKAIMSSAQSLTESSRNAIEEAFGARVFDKYGSREFSGIAYECDHGRDHHVMDESYLVELLVDGRPAEPGETGEVVITDLNNFSVPLIRYRIGDLAVAVDNTTACPCGRHLSRIGRIEGRTQAIVHCADGTWLPGAFFSHFFKEYEHAVRFFQVHQSTVGAMTLRVVKNSRFTQEALDELLAGLRRFTGERMAIDVEFVESIPLGVTGKRAPVVSEIALDFQHLKPSVDR
jgi:phenylacetate-CoA ligase